MKKFYLLLMGLVICLGCTSDSIFSDADFAGKTFDHRFFGTLKECIDAQPDPNFFINCHQELAFISESEARIILTDIINTVQYTATGNLIIIKASSTTEFANDIIFEIIDESTLKELTTKNQWSERFGESPWD